MPDGFGGLGLAAKIAGLWPFGDKDEGGGEEGFSDARQGERQAIGGDPSQGFYNTTAPPGGEPPKSPSGHNWYSDEELAAWDAAGRPPNHNYLNRSGPQWGS